MARKIGIGIIGAGVISEIYLQNLTSLWHHMEVVGIADLMPDRAHVRAQQFGVEAMGVDTILAHPDVDIVLNLTIPAAHAQIAMQAIVAGKAIFTEKPLATSLADGRAILRAAAGAGVRVGNAPDTFLGAGLQTVRKAIDDGIIGTPLSFNARMITHGMESWHPDPFFFYQPGGGPMLDMGPYYITALTTILGPVAQITAHTSAGFAERIITSAPKQGQRVPVSTPTHYDSVVSLENGISGTFTTSFDLWDPEHSLFLIYGTEGTLRVPDPNTFGGPVRVFTPETEAWTDLPLVEGFAENSRGIGIADMAASMLANEPHRASGELGYHVLEVMLGALHSGEMGESVAITSTVERPAPRGTL